MLLRGGKGRCKRCRQPIRWVYTRRGKAMPLDERERIADDAALNGYVALNGRAVPLFNLDAFKVERGQVGRICHLETCTGQTPLEKRALLDSDETPF